MTDRINPGPGVLDVLAVTNYYSRSIKDVFEEGKAIGRAVALEQVAQWFDDRATVFERGAETAMAAGQSVKAEIFQGEAQSCRLYATEIRAGRTVKHPTDGG